MIKNVPVNTNKAMRAVVLKHPNSFEAEVYRKKILRADTGTMGGLPTLGGMGVLDSEDEDNFEVVKLGDARMLPCEPFQISSVTDRQDGIDTAEGVLLYCMVESVAAPDQDGYFQLKTHDFVFLVVWGGITVGYEVEGVETNINIPPYTRRYILNKRDDLQFLGLTK